MPLNSVSSTAQDPLNDFAFVTLQLRTNCNYKCHYCIGGKQHVDTIPFNLAAIQATYEKIGKFFVTTFENGRGEPSLHPQILDTLKLVTKFGIVRISTNNSSSPLAWIPRNNADRIHVNLSLHPQGENQFDAFIDNLKIVLGMGAKAKVSYVCHPTRLMKLSEIRERVLALGVMFDVQPFIGVFHGKNYPEAYTETERLLLCGARHERDLNHEVYAEFPMRNFAGIPCLAGHRVFNINPMGVLFRCVYDLEPLAAVHSEPVPCSVNWCGCGFNLKDFNLLNNELAFLKREFGYMGTVPFEGTIDTNIEYIKFRKLQFLNLLVKHKKIDKEKFEAWLSKIS